VADWIGYQSYRAIRLAVPNFSAESKNCYSRKEIKWLYEGLNVVKYVIRYEHLHEDLCFLLANRLSYCMRVPEAVAYIRNTSPINSSQRVDRDMDNPELRAGVRKLLNQREWLLRKVMGYKFPMASGANGKEKPPGPPVSVVPADLSGSATLSPDPVPQEISTKRASLVPVC
jgi:hypothetical protein